VSPAVLPALLSAPLAQEKDQKAQNNDKLKAAGIAIAGRLVHLIKEQP